MPKNVSSSRGKRKEAISPRERAMLVKILQLPPRRQEELNAVIDDMLSQEQRQLSPGPRGDLEEDATRLLADQEYERLVRVAQALSLPVLARIWDNPKDADYNGL